MTPELFDQLPIAKVSDYQLVSGGDINQAYQLKTETGNRYFLLIQPDHTKDFFTHEVVGLRLLAKTVVVPHVISYGDFNGDAYLLLTYINHQSAGDQRELGEQLGKLHKRTSPNHQFGFDGNFTMGTYTADNTWQSDWETFFVNQRLIPLKQLIQTRNLWAAEMETTFSQAVKVFKRLMRTHHPVPSLLHGDLWSGNYLFDETGQPVFIDPAVFYGDREFDIGITRVFGGFNADFYSGYETVNSLEPGYENRLPFYQLYYLMFHLSQFCAGYQGSVLQLLTLCAAK